MVEVRITCGPNILCGKPVITGTRISVELIMEKIGYGETITELLTAYPHLNEEAIRAAIEFGSQMFPANTSVE